MTKFCFTERRFVVFQKDNFTDYYIIDKFLDGITLLFSFRLVVQTGLRKHWKDISVTHSPGQMSKLPVKDLSQI
jgi:hypothetical protein